jgi:putative transposase
VINRGYKFRLYATDEQQKLFSQFSGVCRFVYNLGLEQRRDWGRLFKANTGSSISVASQNRELTLLRAEVDWIAAVPIDCLQYALRDLDRAYQNFFAGRAGYPSPKKRGGNNAFRFPFARSRFIKLNAKWAVVYVPKVGEVKFRLTRDIPGRVKNVTIAMDALGWHVVFSTETEHDVPENFSPAIGIDRGVVHTIALSDGTFRDMPREQLKLLDRRARKHQKKLARCKSGSNRRNSARKLLARTKAKAARIRLHWNHVTTTRIANEFGVVVVENLKIVNMTASAKGTVEEPGRNVRAKAGLNRAILNMAWGQWAIFADYKLAERGGELRKVPAPNTSIGCRMCGCINKVNRESQAVFHCRSCGHTEHADTHAARNILKAGTQPASRVAAGRPTKRELKRTA